MFLICCINKGKSYLHLHTDFTSIFNAQGGLSNLKAYKAKALTTKSRRNHIQKVKSNIFADFIKLCTAHNAI